MSNSRLAVEHGSAPVMPGTPDRRRIGGPPTCRHQKFWGGPQLAGFRDRCRLKRHALILPRPAALIRGRRAFKRLKLSTHISQLALARVGVIFPRWNVAQDPARTGHWWHIKVEESIIFVCRDRRHRQSGGNHRAVAMRMRLPTQKARRSSPF